MSQLLFLEDFAEPADGATADLTDPTLLPGYQLGRSDAQAEADQDQQRLRAEVVQALSDMSFGYAEAEMHILQSMQGLFTALIDKVLPAVLKDCLATRIHALLTAAAAADAKHPVTLRAPPDQIPALQSAAALQTAIPLIWIPEDDAATTVVTVASASGETALDTDALLAELRAALSAIFDVTESEARHG